MEKGQVVSTLSPTPVGLISQPPAWLLPPDHVAITDHRPAAYIEQCNALIIIGRVDSAIPGAAERKDGQLCRLLMHWIHKPAWCNNRKCLLRYSSLCFIGKAGEIRLELSPSWGYEWEPLDLTISAYTTDPLEHIKSFSKPNWPSDVIKLMAALTKSYALDPISVHLLKVCIQGHNAATIHSTKLSTTCFLMMTFLAHWKLPSLCHWCSTAITWQRGP